MASITALLILLLCPAALARPAVHLHELDKAPEAFVGRTLILKTRMEIVGRATWLRDETDTRSRTVAVVFDPDCETHSLAGVARLIRQARKRTGLYYPTPGSNAIEARVQTAHVTLEGRLEPNPAFTSGAPNKASSPIPDVSVFELPYTFVVTQVHSFHTIKRSQPMRAAELSHAAERAQREFVLALDAVARAR